MSRRMSDPVLLLPLILGALLVAGMLLARVGQDIQQVAPALAVQTGPNGITSRQPKDSQHARNTGLLPAPQGLEDLWSSYLQALRNRRIVEAYNVRDEMLKRVPRERRPELERRLKEAEREEESRQHAREHLPKGSLLDEVEVRELAVRLSHASSFEEIDGLFAQVKEREIPGALGLELVEIILRTSNKYGQERLIQLLNNIADPESGRALASLLEPACPKAIRLQALKLLKAHRDDPLEQELYIRLFRGESDEEVREGVAYHLDSKNADARSILRSCLTEGNETLRCLGVGAFRTESAEDRGILISTLKDDQSSDVRLVAGERLARTDPPTAETVDALAWAVQHDRSAHTRRWLISALGNRTLHGNPVIRSALVAVAEGDPVPGLRDDATQALKWFDKP